VSGNSLYSLELELRQHIWAQL